MLDCLILGDSIAVGTHLSKPECAAYAKSGINSWQFNKRYPGKFFSNIVVISLGSNDHRAVNTRQQLELLRSRVVAKSRVYWILPAGNTKASEVPIENIQAIVKELAAKNGDIVLPIQHASPDGIHPTGRGYKDLAAKIR